MQRPEARAHNPGTAAAPKTRNNRESVDEKPATTARGSAKNPQQPREGPGEEETSLTTDSDAYSPPAATDLIAGTPSTMPNSKGPDFGLRVSRWVRPILGCRAELPCEHSVDLEVAQ